ncbi:MAG: hypothetical protein V3T05_10735 [Myxococcota bacterium]
MSAALWAGLLSCTTRQTADADAASTTKTSDITIENVGFATPESVLYDAAADVYLVTNINGSPLEKDDNGFVSRVSPDGSISSLEWIAGTQDDVSLNAPKGMAITNGVLYIADIDAVRMFDAADGTPKGSIEIAGATFLNDVTVGNDGLVYVSDSGLKAGASGFEPSGTDAVYRINSDKSVEKLAEGDALGRPNGLVPAGADLLVVTFGSGEVYRLSRDGKRHNVLKPPGGALDGVVALPDGTFLMSSWEAKSLFVMKADGSFETVATGLESPADIGFDSKRKRVLVPLFLVNKVVLKSL